MSNLPKDIQNMIEEGKTALSMPKIKPTALDVVFDVLDITNGLQKQFESVLIVEKKKYFYFFLGGMLSMLTTMIIALLALGFFDIAFYLKFVLTIIGSLALAFFTSKFREIIQLNTNDPEKLKQMLRVIVDKLTEQAKKPE